jgi:hypothetical protein
MLCRVVLQVPRMQSKMTVCLNSEAPISKGISIDIFCMMCEVSVFW